MPPVLHQLPVDPGQFLDDPLRDEVRYFRFMMFQWDFFNVGSTVDNLMAIFTPNRSGRTPDRMNEATKREVERCFWQQMEPLCISYRLECCNQIMDTLRNQKNALDAVIRRYVEVWRLLRAEG